MASGTDSPSGLDKTSSLELALDQAIAQRYAAAHERGAKKRRNTPTPRLPMRLDMAHTPTEKLARTSSLPPEPAPETALMRPPARLRWKGIEVSDEFQEYAARIARGEVLEPYRGTVLSRPSDEFPWSAARERQTLLPPPSASQRPSLAPVTMPLLTPPEAEPATYPERGRALKTALWVAGAVSSIIGALGVGAGATNNAGNEFDELVPDPGELAQKPSPAAAARGEALASSTDNRREIESSIGERQLASLAADNERAEVNAKAASASKLARTPTARLPAPPLAARPQLPAPNPRSPGAPPSSPTPSSASRLAVPPSSSAPAAGGPTRAGAVPTARSGEGDKPSPSERASLFSDRPSF